MDQYDEQESCIGCEHFKPYKCGKHKDGTDNLVLCCELDRCPYGKYDD